MAVAEVHVRSWQVAYRLLLPDAYLDALRAEDRAARYTFDRDGPDDPSTIVVLVGDVIRGFATIGPARSVEDRNVGELLALYVDPHSWGMGLGRRLIIEARRRLAAHGFTEAILWLLPATPVLSASIEPTAGFRMGHAEPNRSGA